MPQLASIPPIPPKSKPFLPPKQTINKSKEDVDRLNKVKISAQACRPGHSYPHHMSSNVWNMLLHEPAMIPMILLKISNSHNFVIGNITPIQKSLAAAFYSLYLLLNLIQIQKLQEILRKSSQIINGEMALGRQNSEVLLGLFLFFHFVLI